MVEEKKAFCKEGYDPEEEDCQKCVDAEECKAHTEKAQVNPELPHKKEKKPAELPEETKTGYKGSEVTKIFLSSEIASLMQYIDVKFKALTTDIMIALGAATPESGAKKAEPTFDEEMDVSPEQNEEMTPEDSKPEVSTDEDKNGNEESVQEQNEMLLKESRVPDPIFKKTFSEMMVDFAETWNDGFDMGDGKVVKGEAAFRVFQEDTKNYQLGSKRKALGVIRVVAERIYGVSQNRTFKLINEEFCLKFDIDFSK